MKRSLKRNAFLFLKLPFHSQKTKIRISFLAKAAKQAVFILRRRRLSVLITTEGAFLFFTGLPIKYANRENFYAKDIL